MIYHSALCLFFLSLSVSPCSPLPISFCFCLSPFLPLLFSVEIYGRMSTDLLPTPAKSHYIFQLFLSVLYTASFFTCYCHVIHLFSFIFLSLFLSLSFFSPPLFLSPSSLSPPLSLPLPLSLSLSLPPSLPPSLGVLHADPGVIKEHDRIFCLFCHKCQCVFHDRLIDKIDKKYFYGILSEMSSEYFSKVL